MLPAAAAAKAYASGTKVLNRPYIPLAAFGYSVFRKLYIIKKHLAKYFTYLLPLSIQLARLLWMFMLKN